MISQQVNVSSSNLVRMIQDQEVGNVRAQNLHDDQTKYKMRNGLPETYPLFFSLWISLNQDWQEFLFEQFRIMRPGWTDRQLKNAFAGYIKDKVCFTDGHAPQNGYCDFINKENMGAAGFGYRTIGTGGRIYNILGGPYSKGGVRHWQIETLDTTKPPPDPQVVNMFTRPDLIAPATVRTRDTLPNGLRRVDPFPQLGGADVPELTISNVYIRGVFQHNFLREDWLKFIPAGSNPSPYVR